MRMTIIQITRVCGDSVQHTLLLLGSSRVDPFFFSPLLRLSDLRFESRDALLEQFNRLG